MHTEVLQESGHDFCLLSLLNISAQVLKSVMSQLLTADSEQEYL